VTVTKIQNCKHKNVVQLLKISAMMIIQMSRRSRFLTFLRFCCQHPPLKFRAPNYPCNQNSPSASAIARLQTVGAAAAASTAVFIASLMAFKLLGPGEMQGGLLFRPFELIRREVLTEGSMSVPKHKTKTRWFCLLVHFTPQFFIRLELLELPLYHCKSRQPAVSNCSLNK
jgi:hypothetical protein